jgi:coenzyme PQQ precursor peptide PqqA
MELGRRPRSYDDCLRGRQREEGMMWITPELEEISIGLEINGYLPAEF